MSKLLINEPPLQVLPSLAKLVGLSEAIVLQQLHWESRRSKEDGWVQKPIVDWHAQDFFFMSLATVERAFRRLRELDLIVTDVVAVPREGRRTRATRMRVNMETLEQLEIPARRSRQIEGTRNPQIEGTSTVKLRGPLLNRGTERTTTERTPIAPTGAGTASLDPVVEVFDAWRGSTGHVAAVLDEKRRRTIEKALKLFPLADVIDAVRGWRHSPHHRGENDRRTVYDGIHVLLRDAEQIEKMRDLERANGGGEETGTCPAVIDAKLVQKWQEVVIPDLQAAVDESTFDVWLADLHPHRRDGDVLIVAAPDGKADWIRDRFGPLLRHVIGRDLQIVTCNSTNSTDQRSAAA